MIDSGRSATSLLSDRRPHFGEYRANRAYRPVEARHFESLSPDDGPGAREGRECEHSLGGAELVAAIVRRTRLTDLILP
jgi:hypothetical protein